MSRRSLNTGSGSNNPAKRFIEWKSSDKVFSFYNKEESENQEIPLPFRFQFLEEFHTIKGWNDASESGIYSNQVKYISKEPLEVKAHKAKKTLASGLYSEVRTAIKDAGGVYHKNVYAVDAEGNIIVIQLKGSAVAEYGKFMDDNKNSIESFWIEVLTSEDLTKGKVKYSVPTFTIGKAFTKAELSLADQSYTEVADYFSGKGADISDDSGEVETEEEPEVAF